MRRPVIADERQMVEVRAGREVERDDEGQHAGQSQPPDASRIVRPR